MGTRRFSDIPSESYDVIITSCHVTILCRLLRGCNSWYEVMVGLLLFTTPLVISTDYDLVYTAEVGPTLHSTPLHSLHVLDVCWSL